MPAEDDYFLARATVTGSSLELWRERPPGGSTEVLHLPGEQLRRVGEMLVAAADAREREAEERRLKLAPGPFEIRISDNAPVAAAKPFYEWHGSRLHVSAELRGEIVRIQTSNPAGYNGETVLPAEALIALGARLADDRLDRLAGQDLLVRGTAAIGDAAAFRRWLQAPARALGGKRPADLLSAPDGRARVERLLAQIENGVYP